MMYRNMKKAGTVLCAICLAVAFTLPAYCMGLEQPQAVTAYIEEETNGFAETKQLTDSNYRMAKERLLQTGKSEKQANRAILDALGFMEGSQAGREKVLSLMENTSAIEVQSQYFQVDDLGEQRPLTREQCIQRAKRAHDAQRETQQAAQAFSAAPMALFPERSIDSLWENSTDGYLELSIAYLYDRDMRKFIFIGYANWLKIPFTRATDALSLYCSDTAWHNKEPGKYGAVVETQFDQQVIQNNVVVSQKTFNTTQESDYRNVVSQPQGFYYQWKLPSNITTGEVRVYYKQLTITITGQANLKATGEKGFNVFLNYAHRKIKLFVDVQFGWSTGNIPGVSFVGGLEFQKAYYPLRLLVK